MGRRRHSSRWLRGATAAEGGLFIPGRPQRHGAGILLSSTHAEVRMAGRSAVLDWVDYLGGVSPLRRPGDWWLVSGWVSGRGGPLGIAVELSGRSVTSTEGVRERCRTLRNRLIHAFEGGVAVPLCAIEYLSNAIDIDRDFTHALCAIFADKPAIRQNLGDPSRVGRLIEEFTTQPHHAEPERIGWTRTAFLVLYSLRRLGYSHRYGGRPLPDEELPDIELVTGRVLERLRSSPVASETAINPWFAAEIIRHFYLEIEPWPITALTD